MDYYGSQLGRLIEQLSSLPGIGSKTAQRLAFHIVNMPVEKVQALSDSIISAKKNVRYCKECFTMTDQELCPICGNPKRNHRMIMVVENTRDLAAYEKTGKYDGTNSSLEGETTAMYISKLIKPTGIKVSRIASGVPVGGDLEYIDEVTLLRALEGRVEL